MSVILERLIPLLIGYAFGCISFAYIFGHVVGHIDIRNYGSGNAGTTNVIRVLGKKWGFLTLALDILKAACAVWVTALIYGYGMKHLLLWAGIGVILGHNFPFYMNFKGGKGIAASIGIFLAADIRMMLIAGIPALIILYIWRYMSLASLTYMLLLFVTAIFFYHGAPNGLEVILLVLLISLSGFIRHRANIRRLLEGTESKLGQKVEIAAEKHDQKMAAKGITPDNTPDDQIYQEALQPNDKEKDEKRK